MQRLGVIERHLTAGHDTGSNSSSPWAKVPQAPPDPILGVSEAWKADSSPDKLNLGVGAYRTEEGAPLVLAAVRKAEARLVAATAAGQRNKEYLPIGGDPTFCSLSQQLAFGHDCQARREGRIATVQTLSGTGALRVGAEYLAAWYPVKQVLLPNPTWGNHKAIFGTTGLRLGQYRYFDPATKGLDYQGLLSDLRAAQPGAVVVLHACAHNPTGVDPSLQQWRGILDVMQQRRLLPFFDCAYQGFASGDLEQDAAALRLFAAAGGPLLLSQSYAKNLGLYGERVGALSVVCSSQEEAGRVASQLRAAIRPMYSSPPGHGAAIAALVMGDPALLAEWKEELQGMAGRIQQMRVALLQALHQERVPGNWDHVVRQIGMFSYTGLTPAQCQRLTQRWHVYLTGDGRISMAGLSSSRVGYLAAAIKDVVLACPQ